MSLVTSSAVKRTRSRRKRRKLNPDHSAIEPRIQDINSRISSLETDSRFPDIDEAPVPEDRRPQESDELLRRLQYAEKRLSRLEKWAKIHCCPVSSCSKSFSRPCHLLRHIKSGTDPAHRQYRTDMKWYTCRACNQPFSSRQGRSFHFNSLHRGSIAFQLRDSPQISSDEQSDDDSPRLTADNDTRRPAIGTFTTASNAATASNPATVLCQSTPVCANQKLNPVLNTSSPTLELFGGIFDEIAPTPLYSGMFDGNDFILPPYEAGATEYGAIPTLEPSQLYSATFDNNLSRSFV